MTSSTNPLSYNAFITAMCELAVYQYSTVANVVTPTDANVTALIPSLLDYAELRIQRDLNLLPSLTSRPYTMTTGNNQLTLPVDDFVEIETIQAGGNSLLPVSKEWLFACYPTGSTNGAPIYFAMLGGDLATGGATSSYILLGPPPDQNYSTTIFGRVRLPSLYTFANSTDAGNKYTFISTYLGDLLIQASMIYISQYQRQFGPTIAGQNAGDMPGSYEYQYQQLLKGAVVEESRKIFAAGAWSSQGPTPIATASR